MDKKKPLYCLPNPNKIVGKRINKTKAGHSKIYKNLSDLPIEINLEGKENQSIGSINRPHSAINQEHPHKILRIDSALSHCPQPNRKRLSLDSTNKRHQRDSLMSRNSISKKPSKNQIVIDEATKIRFAEDRKRYNSSCGSAIDDKRIDCKKKGWQKPKKLSINNLQMAKKQGEKSQTRMKEEKSLMMRDKTDKSKSKSKNKNKRKQSTTQLDKSKASTTAIPFINKIQKTDKKFLKKKQSLSTAVISLPTREKKKKIAKKNSEKVEIIEQNSQQQYPINKYEVEPSSKKVRNQSLPKPKSKGKRGSSSKDKHKKTYSLIEQIDYASCINIPSNSSGLINSLSQSSHNSSKIKIIDHWEYRYIADENPTSVNLDQIRYYQGNIEAKRHNEAEFISKNFDNAHHYRKRKDIQMQICEDYPNFNQLELKFLASVMFIQRKWRQYKLYKDIFENFATHQGLPTFIEKSNSKQLNISNGPKSAQKDSNSKYTTQMESAKAAFPDTTQFSKDPQQPVKQYRQECHEDLLVTQLNHQTYLQQREISRNDKPFFQIEEKDKQYIEQQRKSSSSKQLSIKSHRYEFLESQIFPNIHYLLLKKQQLKEDLHKKLSQIAQLQRNDALYYDQYLKLKSKYERQYQRKLKELNKSKQDITKGYLKFIDTYKDIKHEALRRVSSETGLIANMYNKVFSFDQHHITTPSNSSESLKKLAKKMLIRKQFFLTQKLQPFIFNTHLAQNNKNLSQRLHSPQQQQLELSARCFRSKRERTRQQQQYNQKKEMLIEIESFSNERMENKRIKQGYAISPQFEQQQSHKNMILTFTKSDELLPITIISPKDYDQSGGQGIPQNYQRKERIVMQQIIASLTHQLYTELVSIDDKRQHMMSFSPEQQKIKYMHVTDLDIIEEGKSGESSREDKSDEIQIVEEEKFRQIYKIQGLQEKNSQLAHRKHRNSKEYNISPASSEKFAFDSEDILMYAQSFIGFLTKNDVVDEIVVKLNKNQGFTPLEYLKFLRDFQIPDDQYDPLISNQTFIDWQDFFTNKYYPPKTEEDAESFVIRQSITIFHRCIFESIIFLLEELRPCGEKGMPFPWENIIFFPRVILKRNMEQIFKKCIVKLEDTLKVGCGIIDEKHFVYSQEDLERTHEENQDKIINMLEKQLGESPHNWYQVQQHCLEIKLQLQCQIMEYLMLEALDQVLQNY